METRCWEDKDIFIHVEVAQHDGRSSEENEGKGGIFSGYRLQMEAGIGR